MFGLTKASKAVRMIAFAILDEKSHSYNVPIFYPHSDLAIRVFTQIVNSDQHPTVKQFPSDFSLYEIGVFDDLTGKLEGYPEPKFLARGSDLVQRSPLSPVSVS